jgi:hypothetical protein
MSYATYLQNKMAAQQKVVNIRNTTDASMITQKRRFESNLTFFADGKGVGSLAMDTSRPDGVPLLQHASVSFSKGSTRPADASSYTAYRGAQGIRDDSAYKTGVKKNLPCITSIPQPDPEKYRTASQVTREKMACDKSNALLEPPRFVDNTIRLSAMHPEMVSEECCNHNMVKANHTHSEGIHSPVVPTSATGKKSEIMRAPPLFQNQGVGGGRIGAYFTPRSGYVENKHGNDLNVNPRRVPAAYVLDPNAPAHLKINNPKFGNVKPI